MNTDKYRNNLELQIIVGWLKHQEAKALTDDNMEAFKVLNSLRVQHEMMLAKHGKL